MVFGIQIMNKILPFAIDSREGMISVAILQNVILFIIPSILIARIISRRPLSYLHLDKPLRWLPVAGVIFAYLIALPCINQIIYWNDNIVFPEFLESWGELLRENENVANEASAIMLATDTLPGLFVNLAVIGLLTAFGEEIFFRGSVQTAAASNGLPHTAIWCVALLFSAMHMQFFGFIPRLLLGAWFGYLLYWTRSIYVPVLAHFINNGVIVVFAWLAQRGLDFPIDNLGVREYGFPLPAFVSAIAFIVFIYYFKGFFFLRSNKIAETNQVEWQTSNQS